MKVDTVLRRIQIVARGIAEWSLGHTAVFTSQCPFVAHQVGQSWWLLHNIYANDQQKWCLDERIGDKAFLSSGVIARRQHASQGAYRVCFHTVRSSAYDVTVSNTADGRITSVRLALLKEPPIAVSGSSLRSSGDFIVVSVGWARSCSTRIVTKSTELN